MVVVEIRGLRLHVSDGETLTFLTFEDRLIKPFEESSEDVKLGLYPIYDSWVLFVLEVLENLGRENFLFMLYDDVRS